MIAVDQLKNLKYSFNDHFKLIALLKDYELVGGESFELSIKNLQDSVVKTIQGVTSQGGDDVEIVFEANSESMKDLKVGSYFYDIHINENGDLKTVMFIAKFEVVRVAHNGV